jgi:hypothetical protein
VRPSRPLVGGDFCPHCHYWLDDPHRGSRRA